MLLDSILCRSTMSTRHSPSKQPRAKNLQSVSITSSTRMRPTSGMVTSYSRNHNPHQRHYSHTISPTAMSASSLPAVPLFYSTAYADPPECSSLPQPPESWYLPSSTDIYEEKEISTATKVKSSRISHCKSSNQGFYSPFSSAKRFPPAYISVRA
jgi:hypothetical protein